MKPSLKPPKAVTLQDIATYTGYSRMTVSVAITGRGRINDDSRKEILAAAKKLNYVPNMFARGWRNAERTGIIALVSNDENIPRLMEWVKAIQHEGSLAIVIHDDESKATFDTLERCRADAAIWFHLDPPKTAPIPVTEGKGNPFNVVRELLKEKD